MDQTIHLCGHSAGGGTCGKPAVANFMWAWGERGACCAEHQTALNQLASNLKRNITFMALDGPTPPTIGRDERTRLQAEILVLREEAQEAKDRGLSLYKANAELAEQARLAAIRERELRAQVKDALAEKASAEEKAAEAAREAARCSFEMQKLHRLSTAANAGADDSRSRLAEAESKLELARVALEKTDKEKQALEAELAKLRPHK